MPSSMEAELMLQYMLLPPEFLIVTEPPAPETEIAEELNTMFAGGTTGAGRLVVLGGAATCLVGVVVLGPEVVPFDGPDDLEPDTVDPPVVPDFEPDVEALPEPLVEPDVEPVEPDVFEEPDEPDVESLGRVAGAAGGERHVGRPVRALPGLQRSVTRALGDHQHGDASDQQQHRGDDGDDGDVATMVVTVGDLADGEHRGWRRSGALRRLAHVAPHATGDRSQDGPARSRAHAIGGGRWGGGLGRSRQRLRRPRHPRR